MRPSHAFKVVSIAGFCLAGAWVPSGDNVHLFLTFDEAMYPVNISAAANVTDFVWGGHLPLVWKENNPATVVSQYITYNRDPDASHNLAWWQANFPSWVLYQCDRKTPANVDPADPNIALDVSNPAVVAWQVAAWGVNASAAGFRAIAADNYEINNDPHGCGVWRSPGSWVQLYNGTVSQDPVYAAAQLAWLTAVRAGLHALQPPLSLVPNYELDRAFNDTHAMQIAASVDAILDERGFTDWGTQLLAADDWENVVGWMELVQRSGGRFFSINRYSGLTAAVRNFVVASWALGNNGASAVYMCEVNGRAAPVHPRRRWRGRRLDTYSLCYGYANDFPEYHLVVGHAVEARHVDPSGVWRRALSTGLALLNPVGANTSKVALADGARYRDAEGALYAGEVTLPGGSGLLLELV